MSEPEEANAADIENIWDDTLLIKAYDDSVNMAKEELARRIASSTNSLAKNSPGREEDAKQQEGECSTATTDQAADQAPLVFKVGDYARATYDDGIDYEAKILSINVEENTCQLEYIGYENQQEVRLSDLVASWGKKARRIQFAKAKEAAGDETPSVIANGESGSNGTKKKNKTLLDGSHDFFHSIPPPPPMPPLLGQMTGNLGESEHVSAMLMSWYMSGYYTGVYQGMQLAKGKGKPKEAKKKETN